MDRVNICRVVVTHHCWCTLKILIKCLPLSVILGQTVFELKQQIRSDDKMQFNDINEVLRPNDTCRCANAGQK